MRAVAIFLILLLTGTLLEMPRAQELLDRAAPQTDTLTGRGSGDEQDARDASPVASSISFRPEHIWDSFRVLPPGSIVVQDDARQPGEQHASERSEGLFYSLLGMLLVLAVLRRSFPKYWSDLFRLFFRTTLRQRQLRDQMELASLPSLAMNIFFFLCLAFYGSLYLTRRGWNPFDDYWSLWLLMLAGLMAVYFVKWLSLRFAAWVFGQSQLGEDYSFLVFTVNKMLGLFLLPAVIGMAFGEGWVVSWLFDLSSGTASGSHESFSFSLVLVGLRVGPPDGIVSLSNRIFY